MPEVAAQINSGNVPIHEPGLQELNSQYGGTRLTATTDYDAILNTEVTFLALPTSSQADGPIETSYIEAACESLGEVLSEKDRSLFDSMEEPVIIDDRCIVYPRDRIVYEGLTW